MAWTDEDLDAFDEMHKDNRAFAYKQMPPSDRDAFMSALRKRRSNREVAAKEKTRLAEAEARNAAAESAPDPTDPLNQSLAPGAVLERGLAAASDLNYSHFVNPALGAVKALDVAQESIVAPLVRRAQEYVGKPVVKFALHDPYDIVTKGVLPEGAQPTAKLLERSATQWLEGEDEMAKATAASGATEGLASVGRAMAPAVSRLAGPEATSAAVQSSAVSLGKLPLEIPGMFVGAGGAGGIIGRLAKTALFGGGEAAVQALAAPGQGRKSDIAPVSEKPSTNFAMGVAIGAGFGAMAEGGGKIIAALRGTDMKILDSEMRKFAMEQARAQMDEQIGKAYRGEAARAAGVKMPDPNEPVSGLITTERPLGAVMPIHVKMTDKGFNPSVASTQVIDGVPYGVAVEIGPQGTRVAVEPLNTSEGVDRFFRSTKKAHVPLLSKENEGALGLTPEGRILSRRIIQHQREMHKQGLVKSIEEKLTPDVEGSKTFIPRDVEGTQVLAEAEPELGGTKAGSPQRAAAPKAKHSIAIKMQLEESAWGKARKAYNLPSHPMDLDSVEGLSPSMVYARKEDGSLSVMQIGRAPKDTSTPRVGDDVEVNTPEGPMRGVATDRAYNGRLVVTLQPGAAAAQGPQLKITEALPEAAIEIEVQPGDARVIAPTEAAKPGAVVTQYLGKVGKDKIRVQTSTGQVRVIPLSAVSETVIAQPKFLGKIQPPPVPPPQFRQLSQMEQATADLAARIFNKMRVADLPMGERVLRQILSPFQFQLLRGSHDLAEHLLMQQSLSQVGGMEEVYSAMRKMMRNEPEFGAVSRDLNNMMAAYRMRKTAPRAFGEVRSPELKKEHGFENVMRFEDFIAKYNANGNKRISDHAAAFLRQATDEINRLSSSNAMLGGVPLDLEFARLSGLFEDYVTRSYRAHFFKRGEYAKIMGTEAIQNMAEFLVRENPKLGAGETFAEMMDLMHLDGPERKKAFANSKAGEKWKNLLHREESLPKPIQEFLGKESSGFFNMAQTLATARIANAHLRMWKNVIDAGALHREAGMLAEDGRAFIQVPDEKAKFGHAAGGWVHPDLAPLIHGVEKYIPPERFLHTILGMRKRNLTVFGGFRVWMNNAMRNLKGATLGQTEAGAFYEALQAQQEWYSSPASTARVGVTQQRTVAGTRKNVIQECREFGVIPKGMIEEEVLSPGSRFFKIVRQQVSPDRHITSPLDVVDAFTSTADNYVRGQAKAHLTAQRAYDAIDNTFKIATYITQKRKLLAQGLSNQEAATEAAVRVKMLFADFENVGEVINKARHSAGGMAMSPWLTAQMENYRVNASIPAYLKRNPEAIDDLIRYGMAVVSMGIGMDMAREANGITADHVKASLDFRSLSKQTFSKLLVASPFLDEKGRVKMYNLGAYIEESQLLNGNNQDSPASRVMVNFFAQMAGDLMQQPIQQMMVKAGVFNKAYQERPPMLSERGFDQVAKGFWESGFLGPGALYRAYDDARRAELTGRLGKYEEPWTIGQAIERQLGSPLTDVVSLPDESGNLPKHLMQSYKEVRGSNYDVKAEQRRAREHFDNPEAFQKQLDATYQMRERNMQRFEELQKAQDALEAAKKRKKQ